MYLLPLKATQILRHLRYWWSVEETKKLTIRITIMKTKNIIFKDRNSKTKIPHSILILIKKSVEI